MNMKKKNIFVLLLALAMTLAACGGPAASGPASSAAPPPPETVPAGPVVDTVILREADSEMLNTYTLLAVDPDAPFVDLDGAPVTDVQVNAAGAEALIQWLLSEEGLALAAGYGGEVYGDSLFYRLEDAPVYTGEIQKATDGTGTIRLSTAAGYGREVYGDSLFYRLEDAPVYTGEIQKATDGTGTIRLSTTTSVNDSGLLGALLPVFEERYGYRVEVQSAGTGKAIAAARYGNADLLLVHAKGQEEEFVDQGFSYVLPGFPGERLSFLYNYFVLCGPSADPAGAAESAGVRQAFAAIAQGEHLFISRGDGSGTHTKELSLWPEELGITQEAESFAAYTGWYRSANAGMGACLVMAEEQGGYILTDKATFLAFTANGGKV